jgi:hypothetical protein
VHLNLVKPELSVVYLMFIFRYLMFMFRYIQWESERYRGLRGVMNARCHPLNMQGHQFHNMNIQVYWATAIPYLSHTNPWFMPCLQDIVLTLLQYPVVLEDPFTVPCEECWVVSP